MEQIRTQPRLPVETTLSVQYACDFLLRYMIQRVDHRMSTRPAVRIADSQLEISGVTMPQTLHGEVDHMHHHLPCTSFLKQPMPPQLIDKLTYTSCAYSRTFAMIADHVGNAHTRSAKNYIDISWLCMHCSKITGHLKVLRQQVSSLLFKKIFLWYMWILQALPTGTTPIQHKHTVYYASVYHLEPPLAGGGASPLLGGAGPSLLGGASLSSRESLAAAPKRRGGPSRGADGPSLAAPRGPPPQLGGASLAGASRAAGQPHLCQSSNMTALCCHVLYTMRTHMDMHICLQDSHSS